MTKRAKSADDNIASSIAGINELLGAKGFLGKTLDFVMKPREVPSPVNKSLDAYNWECRQQFHHLLLEAFKRDAFPERASLVQSVLRSVATHAPEKTIDFGLNPYGRASANAASREEARRFCQRQFSALAYVTHWFKSMGGISSHQRFREHGDTTVGNLLIFSGCEDYQLPTPLPFPAHGHFIGLKSRVPNDLPDLTKVHHIDAIPDSSERRPIFEFKMEDCLSESFNVKGLSSSHPPPLVFNSQASCFSGKDPNADRLIKNIQSQKNVEYLSRVAALSEHGQIVISAPQVMYYSEGDDHHRSVFDSGLTILLAGDAPPSLEELLQIFIVSRSIAQYAASVFGIARQVALSDRHETLKTLSKAVKHEVGNMADDVKAKLFLAKTPQKVSNDIEGRIDSTHLSVMASVDHLEGMQVCLLEKFDELCEKWQLRSDIEFRVNKNTFSKKFRVPAAFMLAVNEMLRNAYKHSVTEDGVKGIDCTLTVDHRQLQFEVTNKVLTDNIPSILRAFQNRSKGVRKLWALTDIESMLPHCRLTAGVLQPSQLTVTITMSPI